MIAARPRTALPLTALRFAFAMGAPRSDLFEIGCIGRRKILLPPSHTPPAWTKHDEAGSALATLNRHLLVGF